MSARTNQTAVPAVGPEGIVFAVLLAISFSHFVNDTLQSVLPAIYPVLKTQFRLSFGQIGLLTCVFQVTASLLQPLVGMYSDKRPLPFSLAAGMGFTLIGLVLLSQADSFVMLLVAAAMIGVGSSIFHPRAGGMASPNRSSRSAAMPVAPWGPCLRPSSSCRTASAASCGSRSSPCWAWSSWVESGSGIGKGWPSHGAFPPPFMPMRRYLAEK
jgi:MFS family permease